MQAAHLRRIRNRVLPGTRVLTLARDRLVWAVAHVVAVKERPRPCGQTRSIRDVLYLVGGPPRAGGERVELGGALEFLAVRLGVTTLVASGGGC